MTTAAPIYLVSACASGEEFVAAFRRYTDRNGVVFVPIAEPLPSGTKGRFALTLNNGGVMVDGTAEVVSSARTPSILYGRIGMTVKFLTPDEPSKTILGELEKARLAHKPLPPSIPPRPADVPAGPRAKPPAPNGRIDAANALAECVAIGDGVPASTTIDAIPPKNTAPKFVAPSVSSSPSAGTRAKTPSIPPSIPPRKPTTAPGLAVAPPTSPPSAAPAAPITQRRVNLPDTEHTDLMAFPVLPDHAGPLPDESSDAPSPTHDKAGRETRRTSIGIAIVPSGVMVLPAAPTLRMASEEENRDTSPISAQMPATKIKRDTVDELDALSDTLPPQTHASVSGIQPTVEEPTPSGDWTMTPGAHGLTITPTPRPEKKSKSPPTGDWLIVRDPSRPDGWGEPSNVNRAVRDTGPPVSAVSSEHPLDSSARPMSAPRPDAGAKVEIDPSLIEPATRSSVAVQPGGPTFANVSSPGFDLQHLVNQPRAGFVHETGADPMMPLAGGRRRKIIITAAVAAAVVIGVILIIPGSSGGKKPTSASDRDVAVQPDKPDKPDKPDTPDKPVQVKQDTPDKPVQVKQDEPVVVATPPLDAGVETPATVDAAVVVASTECQTTIVSVPTGAEVVIAKAVVGTTPATLTLPCGIETKVVVRRNRYIAQSRTITPKQEGRKIKITLPRVTFSIKVSSTPAGAKITVGTKSMGVTPTRVKLPGFEVSTVKISKDGFTAETQKITPKQNNQTVHATLKKRSRRGN